MSLPTWWATWRRTGAGLVALRGTAAPGDQVRPVRNRFMSTLVSATASWAARRAQPGIDPACCNCSSYGASSRTGRRVSAGTSVLPSALPTPDPGRIVVFFVFGAMMEL